MQFNVTAVWNHWVPDGGKEEGNPTGDYVDDPWPCVAYPTGSAESNNLQEQVTTGYTLVGEVGAQLPATKDRMSLPGIGPFEVDGTPDVFVSPFPSGRGKIGPVVNLKAVSG